MGHLNTTCLTKEVGGYLTLALRHPRKVAVFIVLVVCDTESRGLQRLYFSLLSKHVSETLKRVNDFHNIAIQHHHLCILLFSKKMGTNKNNLFNTYSMKQPDLYYFETIKMTSQAWSNFVWRIRAAGEYSL